MGQMLDVDLHNPDRYALELGNDVLGGNGFASRLMQDIRVRHGYAYDARSGNQLVISWPTNYSAGLSLRSADSLGAGATWVPVSAPAVTVGNSWMVTNSLTSPNRYFRLSSQ